MRDPNWVDDGIPKTSPPAIQKQASQRTVSSYLALHNTFTSEESAAVERVLLHRIYPTHLLVRGHGGKNQQHILRYRRLATSCVRPDTDGSDQKAIRRYLCGTLAGLSASSRNLQKSWKACP